MNVPEKIQYDGDWVSNKYQGEGTSFYKNGYKIYEGSTKNGFADGYGEKFDFNGKLICKGLWSDNKIEVFYMSQEQKDLGHMIVELGDDLLYVGATDTSSRPHGYGIIWSKDNAVKIFEGGFKKGKKNGFGKYYGEDFDKFPRYIGWFKNDISSGNGMLFHYNGKLEYKGKFINDRFDEKKSFYVKYKENGMIDFLPNEKNT